MNNLCLLNKVIDTIIKIGGRNTSENYIKVVLDTLINKNSKEIKAISYVTIRDSVSIDSSINELNEEAIAKAINWLLNEIAGIAGDKEGKRIFYREFLGYIGHDFELKLKRIGVNVVG